MATLKPRITVTLKPHVHEVVKRLAHLQGKSMSFVIGDIMETINPPLMRTIALLEAAAEAPKQVKDNLKRTVEDMERDLAKAAGGSLAQLDWLLEELHQGEEPTAVPKARRRPSNPPLVTRGSHSKTGG